MHIMEIALKNILSKKFVVLIKIIVALYDNF